MMAPRNRRNLMAAAVCLLALAGLLATAVTAREGDPVPDVDVTVERIPGYTTLEVRRPSGYDLDPIPDVDVILEGLLGFDTVRLSGDKALATLSIAGLPAGWGMRRDGKRLILSGPTVVPPVRFQLEARESRPERVNVELLRGKEVLVSRMKIEPRMVPPRTVAGTLTGTVRLPPEMSPGETLALRALPDSKLPPGGVWVLAGTVSEPWDGEELRHARAIVNTTRSQIKGRIREASAADPQGGTPIELRGDGGCASLAPIAAVLRARGADLGAGDPLVVREVGSGEAPGEEGAGEIFLADLSPSLRGGHEVAMGTIRNMKFFLTVAEQQPLGIAINEEEDLIAIKEKGVQRLAGEGAAASRAKPPGAGGPRGKEVGKKESWTATGATGSHRAAWTWTRPGALDAAQELPRLVAFEGRPTAGGCRFIPREADDLDLARWARMQAKPDRSGRPTGKPPKAEVHMVSLPTDLRPGDSISARYLDEWGDPWVEVPEIPEVEVAAPRPGGEGLVLESASPYVMAGDQLCVCGTFSALDAVAAFSVAARPAEVVSISDRVAWLQTTSDLIGPAPVQVEGATGEVKTDLVRVRGELDQANLLRGESTPMRLLIEGTTAPLPIRIQNHTPSIISLEGGLDQDTESSGGAVNQVSREVRGLQRGNSELTWELRPAPCPCAPGGDQGQ